MKKHQKFCGMTLSLFSVLALVACNDTSSSLPSSHASDLSSDLESSIVSETPDSSVIDSSSIASVSSEKDSSVAVSSEADSSVASGSSDSSAALELTAADVATAEFAALPDTPVGETLDLSKYVTFKTEDGTVVPTENVEGVTVEQDTLNDTAYILTDTDSPFLVMGQNVGTATIELSLTGADDETVTASAALKIVASEELTSLADSLADLTDNYTLSFSGLEGARTENYYSTGTEGEVVLSDGKLYSFSTEDIDGTGLTVFAGALADDGQEALEEDMPALSIDAEDIVYEPYFEAQDLSAYVIEDTANVTTLLENIGLSSYITLDDGSSYYAYGFGIDSVSEGTVSLTLILLDIYTSQLAVISDPFVISDIGSTSLSYLDDYIAAGTIPESGTDAVAERFTSIAEGMNYTVTASGSFHDPETGAVVAEEDLPSYSSLKDFYDAALTERLFMFTEDGEYVDYYMYDSYYGYTHNTFGYFDHADGYVCTFSMEDGKAVIGEKDIDWYTGQATPAPFYDTYGANLSTITAEIVTNAHMTQDAEDPNVYHYAYALDGGKGSYYFDESFVMVLFDLIYPDVTSLYLDDSQGTPMAENITGDITLRDDGGVDFVFTLPTPLDGTTTLDLVITGTIGDVGTTVINGLSDILDDEPAASGDGGWGDWGW